MTYPRHFGLPTPPDWRPPEPRRFDEVEQPNIGWVYLRFSVIVFGVLSFLSLCFFYLLKGMAV